LEKHLPKKKALVWSSQILVKDFQHWRNHFPRDNIFVNYSLFRNHQKMGEIFFKIAMFPYIVQAISSDI
jgi:hypothetical protein